MKSFLAAVFLGILVGATITINGAAPGNFAYGKVAPYIFAGGFLAGFCLSWFPIELALRFVKRRRLDATLIISVVPFFVGALCTGLWEVGRYSDKKESEKIVAGRLDSQAQMEIVRRYQSHFAQGGGPAHDWEALMQLARSPSTDPEVLRAIASDSRLDEFAQFLGRNPSTPDDILEGYAKDRNRAFYLRENPKWKGRVQ